MSAVAAGRIGPNAITRVAEALDLAIGPARGDAIFAAAGLARYRATPPTAMVDEREVTVLHQVLHAELPLATVRTVDRAAGIRTADYLLEKRIPKPVQWLLHLLPAPLAARVLMAAISRHAWTFTGSGKFSVELGQPVRISIAGCPLAQIPDATAPVCDYFAAVFERLFRVLVHPQTTVQETECEALGAPACVFELRWG